MKLPGQSPRHLLLSDVPVKRAGHLSRILAKCRCTELFGGMATALPCFSYQVQMPVATVCEHFPVTCWLISATCDSDHSFVIKKNDVGCSILFWLALWTNAYILLRN